MTFDPLVEERMADGVIIPRSPTSGNPFIVPRGKVDAIEYTRASAMSDFLVRDVHGLAQWEKRYLAQAFGRHPDLAAEAAVQHYSTGPLTGTYPIEARKAAAKELDDIIERALERVGIHEAANAGTAVHKATEPGAPVDPLQDPMANAVKEYRKLTAGLERVASEVFVANDTIRAAGTFDSGYWSPEYPGTLIVGDTKTGKNYHQAEFEVQLAVYAYGEIYLGPPVETHRDHVTEYYADQRLTFEEYFGAPVNKKVGYLVHVPLEGKPKPRIVKLDLERGWRMANIAATIRDTRKEWDRIGIGEKVKHDDLAKREMERLWEDLCDGERQLTNDEFRTRALALHGRFAHIWPEEYTFAVKERLA